MVRKILQLTKENTLIKAVRYSDENDKLQDEKSFMLIQKCEI